MRTRKIILAGLLTLACQAGMANTVASSDVSCLAGSDRIFSITATSVTTCLQAGQGNINGGTGGAEDVSFINAGWTFLDSSDGTSGAHNGWLSGSPSLLNGRAGSFSINSAAYATYDRIAIGFKSGSGGAGPDWVIFELADLTTTGSWEITGNTARDLSHALIYGSGIPTTRIPEPGTFLLLGASLLALAGLSRRKR